MRTTFTVLGAGAWGTAVAILLAENPRHRVRLWCGRPQKAADLLEFRENRAFLPGVAIPESIAILDDPAEALADASLAIAAVPTVYLRKTLSELRPCVPPELPIISLAKGVEIDSFLRPSQILQEIWGTRRIGALSGPSHAEEVSRGQPSSVVAASTDLELSRLVQQVFSSERFRVYTNQDIVGVELSGALKNVLGIAAGISDGLGFGDNAKSALLSRGLVEIARFGIALGAEMSTFYGLAGLGDIMTTCFSPHGRNRRVGLRLAQGESLEAILGSTAMVAEGVYTTRSVHRRARQMGVEMPIVDEVYQVLDEGKSPRQAVTDLMLRRPVAERMAGL